MPRSRSPKRSSDSSARRTARCVSIAVAREAGGETHALAHAIENVDAAVRLRPRHHHVEAVRAEIDARDDLFALGPVQRMPSHARSSASPGRRNTSQRLPSSIARRACASYGPQPGRPAWRGSPLRANAATHPSRSWTPAASGPQPENRSPPGVPSEPNTNGSSMAWHAPSAPREQASRPAEFVHVHFVVPAPALRRAAARASRNMRSRLERGEVLDGVAPRRARLAVGVNEHRARGRGRAARRARAAPLVQLAPRGSRNTNSLHSSRVVPTSTATPRDSPPRTARSAARAARGRPPPGWNGRRLLALRARVHRRLRARGSPRPARGARRGASPAPMPSSSQNESARRARASRVVRRVRRAALRDRASGTARAPPACRAACPRSSRPPTRRRS